MSGRPVTYFTTTIASASTFSSAVDLQKSWADISLVIPSMASGTGMGIYASETLSGTYRVVKTVSASDVTIASTVTNCVLPVANIHAQYLKISLGTATTDTPYTFSIICSD